MIEQNKSGDTPDPNSRIHDLLSALLGGFAAVLLVTLNLHIDKPAVKYPFYKGPRIFPIIVLSVMVLSALPALYRLFRPLKASSWALDNYGWPLKPAIITLLLILFFLCGITWIGVEAAVFLFLTLALYYLRFRSIQVNVVFPLVYTIIIVVIFKFVLKIWFPEPLILSLIGS